ncbi:hypothetical protein AKJ09_09476 [Labilithrix luteola]|uniref:Uncharacterized protein n=1 Tax=Labilithrix luteola TaxID=1391654 RepID=A0A0K1QAQ4_9BACT|nr:hypothetical protein AKJ09_09476 [Labilithrix luteola]
MTALRVSSSLGGVGLTSSTDDVPDGAFRFGGQTNPLVT